MNYSKLLKNTVKSSSQDICQILKLIKRYDRIVVFRHQMPDFDAFGSQLGLATWLKDNFPSKEIHVVRENHVSFTPRLYPEMEIVEDSFFENKFLAIVCDTGNSKRISDERYKKADYIIKIDHHPNKEPYGNINVVFDQLASCSELVVNILLSYGKKYIFSKLAASYFYSGIVGDSGRFLYNSTSSHTFEIANELITTGFNLSKDVYQKMYLKQIDDLKVTAYVLSHFKVSKHGVSYYVLPIDIQEKLKITPERGKENVNMFSNIQGIEIWCSITENPQLGVWKVSIRSKEIAVNGVAEKYNGGGHDNASGCEIKDLSELPQLIKDLDNLIKSK